MPTEPSAVDVLNALTAHIAVLDHNGDIVLVNDAWTRFANENGGHCAAFIGVNYVSVCEQSVAVEHEVSAKEAFELLQALMSGSIASFSLEYPCNSPTEERWFCLRATRASGPENVFVLSHENITARKKVEKELEQILARERTFARTDDLTGAFNRRRFFELAEREYTIAKRDDQPFAIVLFDIDHFKRINDSAGHMVGDHVLRDVANLVRAHLRDADLFARYGGEEFILLLPRTAAVQAVAIAERIRQDLQRSGTIETERAWMLTISSGVAELAPGDDSIDALIRRADSALYQAKQQGRNRTVLAPHPSPSS